MVETWTAVTLAVGVFSVTVRYTLWFGVKNLWYSTLAGAVFLSWCLLRLTLCRLSSEAASILVVAMLLALMKHSQPLITVTALYGTYFLLIGSAWNDRVCTVLDVSAATLVVLTCATGGAMTLGLRLLPGGFRVCEQSVPRDSDLL